MTLKHSRVLAETSEKVATIEKQYSDGLITLTEALTAIEVEIASREVEFFYSYDKPDSLNLTSVERTRLWLACERRRKIFLTEINISILPLPADLPMERTNETK